MNTKTWNNCDTKKCTTSSKRPVDLERTETLLCFNTAVSETVDTASLQKCKAEITTPQDIIPYCSRTSKSNLTFLTPK